MVVGFDYLFTQSGTGKNTIVTVKNIIQIGKKIYTPGDTIGLFDEICYTVDVFGGVGKKFEVDKRGAVYYIKGVTS